MNQPQSPLLTPELLLCIGLVLSAGSLRAGELAFDLPGGMLLQQNAMVVDGRIRLTPAVGGKGTGAVWCDAKQPVKDGFSTTFQLQFTDKRVFGADGIGFVIQNSPEPRVGWPGGNLCFGGLTNLLAVKFDNYHWGPDGYLKYDEIAVLAAPSPETVLWDYPTNTLASVTNKVVFSDQEVHTAKIVYVPGNLQVYLDDMENPLMTVYVNLARVLNLDEGRAWVGFTAATGADWQNQDILSWSFASQHAADHLTRVMPEMLSAKATSPGPTVFAGATDAEPVALSKDHAFGYALPSDVQPLLGIEYSTDLKHWMKLTNAAFYFKDPDSTDSNSRFYRFIKSAGN